MDDFLTCTYLMNCTGHLVRKEKALKNKDVYIYFFSSSECHLEKDILLRLKDIYHEIKKRRIPMEIIYVSSDTNEQVMLNHFKEYHHGWYAIPLNEPTIKELHISYNITFEPQVVVVTSHGELVTKWGKADIENIGKNVIIKWMVPRVV